MNRKSATWVIMAAIVLIVFAAVSCGKKDGAPPAGTTPIADLIQAGKPPIEASSLSRGLSPIAPTFTLTLTNVSDCPVQSVAGTAVFFDTDGHFLPGAKADSGYAELESIKPGEKVELQTMISDEAAVSGQWIIKEVIYLKMNPVDKAYGELPYKWTNPNYEAELAAASAK